MKRIYTEPSLKVMAIKLSGMLCISGGLGGDATENAKAREWGFDWDLEEDEW